MAAITASEARANLYRLIDETAISHQPLLISGKRNKTVLLAEEDWEAVQETLFLFSIPGMSESMREGMAAPSKTASSQEACRRSRRCLFAPNQYSASIGI